MMVQLLIGLLGAIAAGAALLVLGLRGKRVNDHPVCRDCGFDLAGIYPGIVTCPECGSGLNRTKAVRSGQRRKRPIAIGVGAVAVGLPGLVLGVVAFGVMAAADLNTYKPVGLLLWEGRHAGIATSQAAATELLRRVNAGTIKKEGLSRLAGAALDIQGDTHIPWSEQWGDIVESAKGASLLSDEEETRYRNQAAVLEFKVRPRVRIGDPVPVVVTLKEARVGSTTDLAGMPWLGEAKVDSVATIQLPASLEEPWASWAGSTLGGSVGMFAMHGKATPGSSGESGQAGVLLRLPTGIAPGLHTLAMALLLEAAEPQQGSGLVMWKNGRPVGPPDARRHEAVLPFQVLPADAAPIETVMPTPDLTAAMEAYLSPGPVFVTGQSEYSIGPSECFASEEFNLVGLPLDVAFDVYLRADGHEWRLGTLASGNSAAPGAPFPYGPSKGKQRTPAGLLRGFNAKTVDVILRPNKDLALRTIDVERIYGGELVFENVRVRTRLGGIE